MVEFTFYNPTKVVFGNDKIKEIGIILKHNNFKKILLLAGTGSIKKNKIYDQIIISLEKENIEFIELWGVQPNPNLEKAEEALKIAQSNHVDAILAVGGGSVIDTAKSVSGAYYLNNIWDLYEGRAKIIKALPIFAILTISATGSEMNCFAVLSNEKEKKKWAISSELIFPKVTIIDPQVQTSLPWNQTANGAVDAFAHIMEYYSTGRNQETVLALNESLMRSIIKITDSLKGDEKNVELRSNLAWAATLALNGISAIMLGDGDWASHEIEHGLSAFNPTISHGTGLAIILPAWISYISENNPEIFKRWAKEVWNAENLEKALQKMKEKFSSWGMPNNLSELGFKEENLNELSNLIIQRGNFGIVKNLNKEDVLKILKLMI